MVGPAQVDPAQQVKLIDDLVAKKVDVIGLVPLDVKVTGQAVQRARDAGIVVITQEGPNQDGKTWDLELISAQAYGEMQMKALAREMGKEGAYVVYVGTLTTPGHNQWADAAIAYQKAHYPRMKMAADRFPGADLIDTASRVTQDVLQTYPDVRGIVSMGSNGPIGAGNVIRERHLEKKIAIVGTTIPSQAQAMINSGVIREGFLWSPKDAGYGMVARFDSANAAYGESYLLVTILACVLGGVSPMGGFGRVGGLVIALVILQLISTACVLLDLSQFLTLALWGGILLAVGLTGALRGRLSGLLAALRTPAIRHAPPGIR